MSSLVHKMLSYHFISLCRSLIEKVCFLLLRTAVPSSQVSSSFTNFRCWSLKSCGKSFRTHLCLMSSRASTLLSGCLDKDESTTKGRFWWNLQNLHRQVLGTVISFSRLVQFVFNVVLGCYPYRRTHSIFWHSICDISKGTAIISLGGIPKTSTIRHIC